MDRWSNVEEWQTRTRRCVPLTFRRYFWISFDRWVFAWRETRGDSSSSVSFIFTKNTIFIETFIIVISERFVRLSSSSPMSSSMLLLLMPPVAPTSRWMVPIEPKRNRMSIAIRLQLKRRSIRSWTQSIIALYPLLGQVNRCDINMKRSLFIAMSMQWKEERINASTIQWSSFIVLIDIAFSARNHRIDSAIIIRCRIELKWVSRNRWHYLYSTQNYTLLWETSTWCTLANDLSEIRPCLTPLSMFFVIDRSIWDVDQQEILTRSTIIMIPSGKLRWMYSRNVSAVEPVKWWNWSKHFPDEILLDQQESLTWNFL